MKRLATLAVAVGLTIAWWLGTAPPDYLEIGGPISFDDEAVKAAASVDFSARFATELELIPAEIPGHDDIVFLGSDNSSLLASGMDGKLWLYDFSEQSAEIFIDPPLMASGLHESYLDEDYLFFCASYLWGETYPADERVGLYRLHLPSRTINPVVLDVPEAEITGPKVWPLDDTAAPRLTAGGGQKSRPLAFCNDLEVTADGKRIYFSEPFSYPGAAMGGGTFKEVLAANGNGRIWHHDLDSGETRLVVEGFHFLDGVIHDLHPGRDKEESILASLTPGFQILRFHVAGPRAGAAEVIQDSLPGMCDGMDRDAGGNIWCGMIAERSALITWLHETPLVKQVLVRLPVQSVTQPRATAVMALSPDASRILHYAKYEGDKAASIASAIPGPDKQVYVTPFSKAHRGLVRFTNPLSEN